MQNLAKVVLRELAEVLELESFRKRRNRYFLEDADRVLWIEVQKSQASTDDKYVFTINMGAFLPKLAKALGEDIREIDILNGHWNVRLGRMLPAPGEYWWEAENTQQAAMIGKEVAGLIKQYGLPALQRAGSISGLVGFFETGLGIIYAGARREALLSALKQLLASRGPDM